MQVMTDQTTTSTAPGARESRDQLITIIIDDSALDGGGGICLTGLSGQIRIESQSLRAIDLVDCPDLVGIDLSGCGDDLRLRLVEPRRLRWMRLPTGPSGSTVELELPSRFVPVTPLIIQGLIADFDLCAQWLFHPWCLDALKMKLPLNGLFIGPPGTSLAHQRADLHIMVGRAVRHQHLALDCRGVARLMLMGAQVEQLQLDNASLALLDIDECRKLRAVTGRFQARVARVSLCRRLERIGGGGQRLELDHLQAERLAIDGRWLKTAMKECETQRLELQRSTRLHLAQLPGLHTIEAAEPYEMKFSHGMFATDKLVATLGSRPGKLDEFVREEMHHAGQHDAMSTHWLENIALGHDCADLARALSALLDLARNPVDRRAAWLIRCALASLHLHGKGHLSRVVFTGSSRWEWPLGTGAGLDCWAHDLALYFRCRALAVTRPFARTLQTLDRLTPACALARAIDDNILPASAREDCRRWLTNCLEQLNLQHPEDAGAIADPDNQRDGPWQGMAGRLAMSNRAHQQRRLLPTLGRTLAAWDDPGPAELLARAVMEQLPDRGLLLVELGFDYAEAGKQAGPTLIAAGLASGIALPDLQHARAMRYLLHRQPAQSGLSA